MEIKRLVFFFIMVVMVSCSPYNGGGELIGTLLHSLSPVTEQVWGLKINVCD